MKVEVQQEDLHYGCRWAVFVGYQEHASIAFSIRKPSRRLIRRLIKETKRMEPFKQPKSPYKSVAMFRFY